MGKQAKYIIQDQGARKQNWSSNLARLQCPERLLRMGSEGLGPSSVGASSPAAGPGLNLTAPLLSPTSSLWHNLALSWLL